MLKDPAVDKVNVPNVGVFTSMASALPVAASRANASNTIRKSGARGDFRMACDMAWGLRTATKRQPTILEATAQ